MAFYQTSIPRWIIFSVDIGVCLFSLLLAYLLRFNFIIPVKEFNTFVYVIPIALGIRGLSFYFSQTYANIIRYTSTKDAQRIVYVITIGSVIFCILNILKFYYVDQHFLIPFSIVIIDYMTTIFIMIAFRIAVKVMYFELKSPNKEKSNVIIFGAGESGIITKRTLDRDRGTKYKVLAFVDDNEKMIGKKIEGISIYSTKDINELLANNEIAHLIISIQYLKAEKKQEIIETCLAHNVKVLNVPPVIRWINGELSFRQIKQAKIEDLLGREPIKLDEEDIKKQLAGKIVLITGAAGSIGSGLVKQIANYGPKKLLLLDQAESPLYELEFELNGKYKEVTSFEIIIGDIRNYQRMENVFRTFRPEIVFHAAAYKHVPMMENNPSEAIRTNVLGSKNIVDLSIKYDVKTFVLISSDKAVNPTNVMGASKRIAEIYAQSINSISTTNFITTRFGNVLESNGSVIPLFRNQIEKGGPVTVTHPEVTRYFMTISEACQLVLEAGMIGKGGEIFIFDMGKSVKVIDLARKMIKLSRLELGKDISIKFVGLRPGEKLYEELLNDQENTLPTHHPKIMIAQVKGYNFDEVSEKINNLIRLYESQNNNEIVAMMKTIIPEYISQNSIFKELDTVTTL